MAVVAEEWKVETILSRGCLSRVQYLGIDVREVRERNMQLSAENRQRVEIISDDAVRVARSNCLFGLD